MTVTQAAKHIGISPSKLYQLAAARKIAHCRIGSRIIFHEDDIAVFLAGCRITTTPAETVTPAPRLKLKHISLSHGS